MSAPDTQGQTAERRPGEEAASDVSLAATRTTVRDTCADCAQREPVRGWRRCSTCLRAYVDGLDRRRAAELRMPPLDAA